MSAQYLIIQFSPTSLWKLFPDGRIGDATDAMRAEKILPAIEAVKPLEVIELRHMQDLVPYKVLFLNTCVECGGKAYVPSQWLHTIDRESGEVIVRQYVEGEAIPYKHFVRDGQAKCGDCWEDGLSFDLVARDVPRDELMGMFREKS